MKRRGFVFTLDALLSLVLVLIVVTSITVTEESAFQSYSYVMRLNNVYTAEDIITVLSQAPLNSLVNESVIANWTASGVLNESLYVSPSMPPLKIALTYWALSNVSPYNTLNLLDKARTILDYVITHNFPGYGFELSVNSTLIASRGNASLASDVTTASTVMSGFQRGKKPFGYVSRAYLTYAQHFYSQLIGIQRLVAGGPSNTIYVKVPVNLPPDAVNISARGAFYARIIPSNDIYLSVTNESGTYTYGNLGYGSKVDLSDYIGPGNNTLNFEITSGYASEVGFGSGSVLLVSYTTNSTSVQSPNKIDLYDVVSDNYGFVQFVTVVPTGNITNMSVYLQASGIDTVRLYYSNGTSICDTGLSKSFVSGIAYFSPSEIEQGLAQCGVTYSDLNKKAFTIILAFDAEWSQRYSRFIYYYGSQRHLYGFGKSFVEVAVKSKLQTIQYGIPLSIPLYPGEFTYSQRTSFSSSVYKVMDVSYTLPSKAIPWYADYWTAIEYTGTPSGTLSFSENNVPIITGPLNYYLYRFGYAKYNSSILVNGTTNTFEAESTSNYYGFRENETWGNVYYFLQAYAPYGKSFKYLLQGYPDYNGYNLTYWAELYGSSSAPVERHMLVGSAPYLNITINDLNPTDYAVDDAIIRLFSKLAVSNTGRPGTYDNPLSVLLPKSVRMDFSAMTAPSLFVPVPIELKLWRLG